MTLFTRRFTPIVALAASLLLAGAVQAAHHEKADRSVTIGEEVDFRGEVVSVDRLTRTVVIEGEGGGLLSITVPADAPNFDQIGLGDPVAGAYVEAIALAIAPVAGAEPGVTEISAVSTRPPGSTPGGVITEQIELRAVVKAVDPEGRTVTLDVPSGGERTLKVEESIDLENVAVGEQVTVTFTRALAVTIVEEE